MAEELAKTEVHTDTFLMWVKNLLKQNQTKQTQIGKQKTKNS